MVRQGALSCNLINPQLLRTVRRPAKGHLGVLFRPDGPEHFLLLKGNRAPLRAPSSPAAPVASHLPASSPTFLTLRNSDAEMEVYPLGPTREDRVSVIVLWRESITLTPQALEHVLQGCPSSTEVVYVHLDLIFWHSILEQVEQLQLRYPNLKIMTLSRWEDRHTTYRKALERVNSRYVLFHDNNNLNTEHNMLDKLVRAFKTTNPPPVLLAPRVGAVAALGEEVKDHHAVMRVSLVDPAVLGRPSHMDQRPVLHWGGWEGTRLPNTAGLTVLNGPSVEIHSYMIDAGRLRDGFEVFMPECAFASNHICVGLSLYKLFGPEASAVLANATFEYIYPKAHLQLTDIPLTMVRWNPWDSLLSIGFLEHIYQVIYFHQCGWDWHIRMAFHQAEFVGSAEEPLTADPALIAALLHSTYVLNHLTHTLISLPPPPPPSTASSSSSSRLEAAMKALYAKGEEEGWMAPRDVLSWISSNADLFLQLNEEETVGNLLHFSALMKQGSLPPPSALAPNHNSNDTRAWVRQNLPHLSQPQDLPKEKWLHETAKHENIHWCLHRYGFLWVQANFGPATHQQWQEKALVVLHSQRWQVHRYLMLVEREGRGGFRRGLENGAMQTLARERHRGDPSLFRGTLAGVHELDQPMSGYCYEAEWGEWRECQPELPLVSPGFTLVKWGKKVADQEELRGDRGWPVKKLPGLKEEVLAR
ncbi:hypothetical protein QOT17_018893 [Balamuthia mandrillaris]